MDVIYTIYDKQARTRIGGIFVEKHDSAAVRLFYDLLTDERTILGKHPADFELRAAGVITDECKLIPDGYEAGDDFVPQARVVVTGEQWLALRKVDSDAKSA